MFIIICSDMDKYLYINIFIIIYLMFIIYIWIYIFVKCIYFNIDKWYLFFRMICYVIFIILCMELYLIFLCWSGIFIDLFDWNDIFIINLKFIFLVFIKIYKNIWIIFFIYFCLISVNEENFGFICEIFLFFLRN